MEFFGRNILGGSFLEDFLDGIFLGGLFGKFFWEEFNKKLFEYGRNLYLCKDFGFCQERTFVPQRTFVPRVFFSFFGGLLFHGFFLIF